MKGLTKVQTQLLNEETGEVIEDVNVATDAECVTYTNETPTISAHGGIPAGTTFDNVPLQQVLDDILYPYTKPTISLAADPNGGVREKGTSLTPVNLTATIGKKSSNITAVDFYKGSEKIGSVDAPKAAGGAESFSYAGPVEADCQISAKVTDEKGGIVESNKISYTFVYPIYIGYVDADAATPTEEQIEAMEKKVVTKSSQSYTYNITDKRMCIACPPGMTLSKILDPNGFDSTSAFAKQTLAITGLDGTPQNYTVYVSDVTSQSNYKMAFNI